MTFESRNRMRYILADYVSTNLAFALFSVFRYYELPLVNHAFRDLTQFVTFPTLIAGQILFPIVMMCVYWLSGVYSYTSSRSRASEMTTTLFTALIGTLLMFFALLINDLTLERQRDYVMFLALFGLLFVLVYVPRMILTQMTKRKIKSGEVAYETLIVGYSSVPRLFPRQLAKIYPAIGIRPVALVDSENRAQFCTSGTDLSVYDIKDVEAVCREMNIKRVVVIPHPKGWDSTFDVLTGLFALDIPIYVAADSLPPFMFNAQLINLHSEPYIDVSSSHLSASTLNIKRAFDVAISALMIIASAVPMAFMAAAIKLDSDGPVFYRQTRVGLHKKRFDILKLRTMYDGAELDGKPALSYEGDRRVTRVGRFLRKYRLDELPQFLNVLRGDMSIVGPRPERPYFIDEILRREPSYTLIHRVRPGITSLGMVKYGYASTLDEMLRRSRYDMLYLENISIVTDLKIILHTFQTVFSGKGV